MRSDHATAVKLKLDKTFQPCPAELGDELYPNGIFEFNITRILAFVATHVERFPIERVEVDDIANYGSENLDEEAIATADLCRPILLAEISPGLADQAYVGTCRWQRHGDLQPIRLREGDARGVRALGHGADCWRVRCREHMARTGDDSVCDRGSYASGMTMSADYQGVLRRRGAATATVRCRLWVERRQLEAVVRRSATDLGVSTRLGWNGRH
jgi:hypothetical protein